MYLKITEEECLKLIAYQSVKDEDEDIRLFEVAMSKKSFQRLFDELRIYFFKLKQNKKGQ